jgi:hypothetical protein
MAKKAGQNAKYTITFICVFLTTVLSLAKTELYARDAFGGLRYAGNDMRKIPSSGAKPITNIAFSPEGISNEDL